MWSNVSPNTLAYRPLTSSSTVNDESGNSHTLSNYNTSFTSNSAYFNWNAYLQIPAISSDTTVSIIMWIKTTQTSQGEFMQLNDQNAQNSFEAQVSGSKFKMESWSPSTISTWSTNIADWKWHHIAITISWNSFKWYVDWVQENSYTFWKTIVLNSTWNILWMHSNHSSNKYTWYIWRVIMEKILRSQSDIQKDYNSSKKYFPN